MRISDWSSDVCSSDLGGGGTETFGVEDLRPDVRVQAGEAQRGKRTDARHDGRDVVEGETELLVFVRGGEERMSLGVHLRETAHENRLHGDPTLGDGGETLGPDGRSDERREGEGGVRTC